MKKLMDCGLYCGVAHGLRACVCAFSCGALTCRLDGALSAQLHYRYNALEVNVLDERYGLASVSHGVGTFPINSEGGGPDFEF